MTTRAVLRRLVLTAFLGLATAFWALPLLWLVTAPFDRRPGLTVSWPRPILWWSR